jgi:hypothetical protein
MSARDLGATLECECDTSFSKAQLEVLSDGDKWSKNTKKKCSFVWAIIPKGISATDFHLGHGLINVVIRQHIPRTY